jgi:acyl-homoserine-lactone acylase
MMRARNRTEWTNAVRMRARVTSNLTYADRDGNIYYVWNATHPAFPRPSGGDTAAVPARGMADVWTRVIAFDSLPQLLNPRGGYVRNENDPPYLTNLHQPIPRDRFPAYFPEVELRLRGQHSLELLHNTRRFTLEDVVATKHSMRMILADRVKDDLLRAVRAGQPTAEVAEALAVLERWDNTAAAESRGGVLFETWWWRYVRTGPQAPPSAASVGFPAVPGALFARPWTAADPMATPRGLGDPARAVEAFAWAVAEVRRKYGGVDVAWGTVHRVRHGSVDVPVGGCSGILGCFRVLGFREEPDGTRTVVGGDGWVLAVEFTTPVRAYSVLAYGQSSVPGSPHHDDQAALFAANRMKPVAFTEADVERATVRRYRPGQ